METYYVVKKGHNVGIFKTWGECKKSVEGYKNPVFRKFNSFEEASVFFKDKKNSSNNNFTSSTIKVINTSPKNKEKSNTINNTNNTLEPILDTSSIKVNSINNSISDIEYKSLQTYKLGI